MPLAGRVGSNPTPGVEISSHRRKLNLRLTELYLMEKTICNYCGRKFDNDNSLKQHKQAKHPKEFQKEMENKIIENMQRKQLINVAKYLTIVLILTIAFLYLPSIIQIKYYPPTTIEGHVEAYPPARVVREPIPEPIQKHILEHVPTSFGNRPGVLIQYNCEKFDCEPDLITKLESLARFYEYLYVAPNTKMDAKIVLTKFGQILILDDYDERKIREFIESF